MTHAERLRKLGYTVGVAFGEPDTDPENSAYRIEGHGITITLPAAGHDDEWERLLVPEAHEHRALEARHHDPDDDFAWKDERTRLESALTASVATGVITAKQKAERLKAHDELEA